MLALGVAQAHAVTITFDETSFPTNAINGFGGFTFGGLGGGAVTSGPTSLTIDASSFGGVGVDFVLESPPTSGMFVPQDFDPNTHQWELRVKLLPGNTATGLNGVFIDDDGAGAAEEFQFGFSLAGVPNDGQFHTVTRDVTSFGFTQTAFGFTAGNGVVDPGLRQIQIQSQFGSTDRLNVEIDYLRITEIVPEPSAIVLGLVAAAACMTRRTN
jgi:hypothetical protein